MLTDFDPELAWRWCDRLARPYRKSFGGAVAGVITMDDELFALYGRIDEDRADEPDQHTLFEIGSITKVFTSVLLAQLASRGELGLEAPIAEIRPEFAGLPDWITPLALATHTSGLPRVPIPLWRLPFLDTSNPYVDFGRDALVDWMKKYRPRKPPRPEVCRYSNLGVGLLGYVLGAVAGTDYETALTEEVLIPLDLKDTALRPNPEQMARLATPHRPGGKPTPPWDFDALAGAGALRSTAHDLAGFCRQVMAAHHGDGPLAEAIARTMEVRIPARRGWPGQCLGWLRFQPSGGPPPFYHHDGGTLGSSSTLYVSPQAQVSVILLANCGINLTQTMRIAKARPHKLMEEVVTHAHPSTA